MESLQGQIKLEADVRCLCLTNAPTGLPGLWEGSRDGSIHLRHRITGAEMGCIRSQEGLYVKSEGDRFFVNAMVPYRTLRVPFPLWPCGPDSAFINA